MNIIKKLTFRHLKNNRSRTILTIVGICVSVTMITAVFTGLYSYLDYRGRVAVFTNGDYHFSVSAPVDKLNDVLGNDDRIDTYGIEYNLGSENGYRLKGAKYKYKSIGSWLVADKNYLKLAITCDYDGRLPENSNEILVEEKFISDNELDWKIGDTVSMESGYRYKGSDYFKFPQNGQYDLNEEFDYASTDEYKIVGILHNNLSTSGVGTMLIRGAEKNQSGSTQALVKLKRVTPFSIIEINSIVNKFDFTEDEKLFGYSTNSQYLETKLALDKYADTMRGLLPMCAVVILLIISVSMVLIYNSFGMSLNEKIKYLGMLSSVGATRRQKKKTVIYEALILSAVGVPLGILTGLAVIKITFVIIGERIKSSVLSGELGSVAEISLDVKLSMIILAIIIFIGFATVIASTIIPSRRASVVSPIDAIRQSEEIKIKHKIRTPFIIRKIFGYEGELAFKNMRRNGAKSKIIVGSIALSLVLFLGCNYFCNLFTISTGLDKNVPYQVTTNFSSNYNDGFKEFADSQPEIKKYYLDEYEWMSQDAVEGEIPLMDTFFDADNFTDSYKDLVDYQGFINFRVIEDNLFNELCEKNGIDYKQYYNYEYGCKDYDDEYGYRIKKPVRVLLLNDFNRTDGKKKPFNDNVIGATIGEMSDPEHPETLEMFFGEGVEITEEMRELARKTVDEMAWKEQYVIYGLADYDEDNYIFQLDGPNSMVAFYPFSVYATKFPDDDGGYGVGYAIETDTHAHTAEIIQEYFESNELSEASVFDDEYWAQRNRSTIIVLKVLIYGFIILTSIITITNIINTISNSISHRKKEFAMLKSVGLTPVGFRKMLSLESLFYALEGIILGLPLSAVVCLAVNKLKFVTVPFAMDIKICAISVCVIFAVIGATMLYSSARVRKAGIIDELKLDIN